MPKPITITVYNDPGHAWAAVPHELIVKLGLVEEISDFSYMTANKVYLEEDCDFTTFLKAAEAAELKIKIKEHYCNSASKIRWYGKYVAGLVGKLIDGNKVRVSWLNDQGTIVGTKGHYLVVSNGQDLYRIPKTRISSFLEPANALVR